MRRRLVATAVACAVLVAGYGGPGAGPVAAGGGAPVDPAALPVVIVAGSGQDDANAAVTYAVLSSRLRRDGHPVFLFGLPGGGAGPFPPTAGALAAFVDGVLAQTGAPEVALIGHSQGGILGRYYIKHLGGAAVVDSMISLGAPHYGSELARLSVLLGDDCLGFLDCGSVVPGSAFLNDLNAGDDTIGDVRYTNIATVFETVVVPYTSGFLAGDGNNTNVTVQRACPLRLVEHNLLLATDGTVYSGIADALAHRPITLDCLAL
jgi:triacylglycerol lipase